MVVLVMKIIIVFLGIMLTGTPPGAVSGDNS